MTRHAVLALDLGTKCGWAVAAPVGQRVISGEAGPVPYLPSVNSGVWDLSPRRFDGGGMRYVRFQGFLKEVIDTGLPHRIYFEEVRAHKGTDAAHIYGGLLATLTALCELRGIPYAGVPVGRIKKFWTGKGNAGKPEMLAAAVKRGYAPKDDNEADALALLHCILEEGE